MIHTIEVKAKIEKNLQDNYGGSITTISKKLTEINSSVPFLSSDELSKTITSELSSIIVVINLLRKFYNEIELAKILSKINNEETFRFLSDIKFKDFFHNSDIFDNIEQIDGFFLLNYYQELQTNEDKKTFGQFYTPISIIDSILELSKIDFACLDSEMILDPAVGGGAFIIRIIDKLYSNGHGASSIAKLISNNLHGYDINPNSIFLTKLCVLIHFLSKFGDVNLLNDVSLDDNYLNIDTLFFNATQKFSYIIGNPPFFKIKSNDRIRKVYGDVLDGQANIYSLFLIWSLSQLRPKGTITFIIPQSIRNGKYFEKVRLRLMKFNVKAINLIDCNKRNSLFKCVEQAVLLISIENDYDKENKINLFFSINGENLKPTKLPQKRILNRDAFFLPANNKEMQLLSKLNSMQKFVEVEKDFIFGNGLFVWNQQKNKLSANVDENHIPIVYASCIKKNEISLFEEIEGDERKPCASKTGNQSFVCMGIKLLVKRTSSMEKFKRIKAYIIDEIFANCYKEYFIENHINMLYARVDKNYSIPIEKLLYILAYLNSDIANYFVKQTNGNTQISATELNNLPYIYSNDREIIEVIKKADYDKLNNKFNEIFDLTREDIEIIEKCKRSCK